MLALANTLAASGALQNPIARGLAELRKFGANAHLYLPGPGVPILGPELVVNGDFNNGTTGWGESFVTRQVVGGQLEITALSQFGSAVQPIQTSVGSVYRLTAMARLGTSAAAFVKLRPEFEGTPVSQSITSSAMMPIAFEFTATSSVSVVELQNLSAGLGNFYVDNVSVKEILGYSNKISGITAGNYLDSIGTTHASVDGLVGLVLDGAGSVGADLCLATSINSGEVITLVPITTLGKTYLILNAPTGLLWHDGSGVYGFAAQARQVIKINTGGTVLNLYQNSGSPIDISAVEVREVTGIHATQATTGNKPTLRRGLVNLLTWSNDLTNGVWVAQGTAGKTGQTLNTPAIGDSMYQTTTLSSGAHTIAVVLSGSGTCHIWGYNSIDGNVGYQQIPLVDTPTLHIVNISPTSANTAFQLGRGGDDTTTAITIGAIGLFKGTYTADQILAAGGIPLTTTAPASSNVGAYAWQFDGDDYLTLGGVPVQMSDDHAVISCAARGADGYLSIFGQGSSSIGNRIQLGIEAGGAIRLSLRSDEVLPNDLAGGATQLGVPFIASYARRGATYVLRGNGGQLNTFDRTFGATTFTEANIGRIGPLGPDPFFGKIHAVAIIKGTVTDVQLLTIERMLNALSGYAAGRF